MLGRMRSLLCLMFSLSVLSGSLLPVKAQRNTNNLPSSALKQAIVSKVTQSSPGIDSGNWDDYKPPFSFAQTDLNDDNKKETIRPLAEFILCYDRGFCFNASDKK
ncbi:MAG: hypothetical protein V7L23_14545 [Nostoc sp.]|uniref:hypothetical protein n=1 Tax=Nostoc sp. TaxID=1180 RepID=UPI002FF2F582